MSISLGCHDIDVTNNNLNAFIDNIISIIGTKDRQLHDDKGPVPFKPIAQRETFRVRQLQTALSQLGFFPAGVADGICGYRTRSAIRLFQEHIRAGTDADCLPDGIAGPVTYRHLQHWLANNIRANWHTNLTEWTNNPLTGGTHYHQWLQFLQDVRSHYQQYPGPLVELITVFNQPADTLTPDDWDFSGRHIHLVGIRHSNRENSVRFDDAIILMIKGLVFQFQGSTDPGDTSHPDGAPFLVTGQHLFKFGLHQGRYHALRPLHFDTHGVLVVRSRTDLHLDAEDFNNGLEANGTINIHWGGRGVAREVNRWSVGCQVIAGSGYLNNNDELVDCSGYAALNEQDIQNSNRTRSAYNVLSDLIAALSSDYAADEPIRYTLIEERDLDINQTIKQRVRNSRLKAAELIDRLS